MDSARVEKELFELEKKYWNAMKNRDVDTALRLTDDSCIVAGAQGVSTLEKSQMSNMLAQSPFTLHDFRLQDPQLRLIGDDVAILAYKVHEDLTVDGRRISLEAADASTWVRHGDRWVCALHTEAILGDPYGRDRHV